MALNKKATQTENDEYHPYYTPEEMRAYRTRDKARQDALKGKVAQTKSKAKALAKAKK